MNQVNFEKLATDLFTEIEELKLQVSALTAKLNSQQPGISREELDEAILKTKAELIIKKVVERRAQMKRETFIRVHTFYTDAMEDKRYDLIVDGTVARIGYTSKWKLENGRR